MTELALRQNLTISEARPDPSGEHRWLLHDPVANRFFQLGSFELNCLKWLGGSADASKVAPESEPFQNFVHFLRVNGLLQCRDEQQRVALRETMAKRRGGSLAGRLLKQYLFIRIPLVRSDRFLTQLLATLAPCFNRWGLLIWLLLTLTGVAMTLQQWSQFSNTFVEMVSLSGLAHFGLALLFVKVIHELGHGLVAKQYGCRVPVMGVAFMVFWPVLYTDTSDAWKLEQRSQRLKIGFAGMAAELAVAGLAMFFWHLLPPGSLKSVCFLWATSTWVLTLLVNLNPLMRFDGYFLLSDWWGVDNLMPRAFDLGRWKLRGVLTGWYETPPEKPSSKLIAYAWACWLYRIVLTLSISLLIYHYVYKPLGIALMANLLFQNFIKPLLSEGSYLKEHWQHFKGRWQFKRSLLLLLLAVAALVYPFEYDLELAAVLKSAQTHKIYAQLDGQVAQRPKQEFFQKGQLLYDISAPDLAFELEQVQQERAQLEWQLAHHSIGRELLQPRPRIQQELLAVISKEQELTALYASRRLMAPFEGRFVVADPWLTQGCWIREGQLLGVLTTPKSSRVESFLSELELSYLPELKEGQTQGRFYPDHGATAPTEVRFEKMDDTAIGHLQEASLASVYGGRIDVRADRQDRLIPTVAHYRLSFTAPEHAPEHEVAGVLVINGEARSLLHSMWLRVAAAFRKESGL